MMLCSRTKIPPGFPLLFPMPAIQAHLLNCNPLHILEDILQCFFSGCSNKIMLRCFRWVNISTETRIIVCNESQQATNLTLACATRVNRPRDICSNYIDTSNKPQYTGHTTSLKKLGKLNLRDSLTAPFPLIKSTSNLIHVLQLL